MGYGKDTFLGQPFAPLKLYKPVLLDLNNIYQFPRSEYDPIEKERFTTVQVIIDIILAITAIYGAAMSTINQLQIRRQMQRTLLVSVKQDVMQLPRIPTDSGGRTVAPVHLFIIQAVNSGLTPVILKDTGMILPGGKFLTQGFVPKLGSKQFPLELVPGADHEVRVDAHEVLKAIKGNGISGEVIVQGYFTTPLKQYKSKKVRLNMELLSNDIKRTEGAWRKLSFLRYPGVFVPDKLPMIGSKSASRRFLGKVAKP
jgi:hypothetical protein